MPWYLAKGFPYDDREQVKGWTEVMRYIRATDPFHRPLTIHPTGIGRLTARNATDDAALLDFDMLQTPHGQRDAVDPTVRTMRESYADKPTMPVIDGEAATKCFSDSLPTAMDARDVLALHDQRRRRPHLRRQRHLAGQPPGPAARPVAASRRQGYGLIPWDEAMNLPGSQQVAKGKKFFDSLPWTKLVPMARQRQVGRCSHPP